jgi:hypothetical protein
MKEAPTCYPYLVGKLTTTFEFLAYNLYKQGIITGEQTQLVEDFVLAEMARVNADERKYSNEFEAIKTSVR